MENLTKSDLINIEAFKGLLKMTVNDAKFIKKSNVPPEDKVDKLLEVYAMRAHLLQNAKKQYPHINWLNEIFPNNSETLKEELKTKVNNKFNFN